MNVFEEFEWRGLIYDASEGLKEALAGQKITGSSYLPAFSWRLVCCHTGAFQPGNCVLL